MDGTPLRPEFEDEQSTLVREPSGSQPSNSLSSKLPLIGCSAVALLILLGLAAAGAYFFLIKDNPRPSANQANMSNVDQDAINKQMANLQQQQADIEKQKQQLANAQKKLENQNNNVAANVIAPTSTDPPTTRITFHRGSVQETMAGNVIKKRVYVLRTLSGQFLYASVTSTGGCVLFSNGAAGVSYETNSGDSQLVIVNKCPSPASYKLTVSVQ
jgi:hypothetical protein